MNYNSLMRGVCVCSLLVAAACSENELLAPGDFAEPLPTQLTTPGTLRCEVNVREATMACAPILPQGPKGADAVIVGGQDKYVKLASQNTSYDGGTQIFSTQVSVQNLLAQAMGTTDGSTPTGVNVFFLSGPTVTSGDVGSSVDVVNKDGTGTFTASDQPYFLYNQILAPYEISDLKTWQFAMTGAVATFAFTVAVSADVVNEAAPLRDKVWQGDAGTDYSNTSNWEGDVAPDASSAVAVPPAADLTGDMPALTASVEATHLRVGTGSTLNLNSFNLTLSGNFDAPGTVSNGTTIMTGSGALLRGNIASLNVTGSTVLQGDTRTSGAVSVTGSLTVPSGTSLTIAIP